MLEDITNDWLQPPDDKIDFEVDGKMTVFRSEYEDVEITVRGRVTEDGFDGGWWYENSMSKNTGTGFDLQLDEAYVDEYLKGLEPSDFENIVK